MRLQEFQRTLEKEKIHRVFLAHPDPTITYFVGQELSAGFLIVEPKKALLYLSSLDLSPSSSSLQVQSLPQDWERALAGTSLRKVGINKKMMPVALFEKLQKMYLAAHLVDVSELLNQYRIVKTPAEIRLLQKAAQLTDRAFSFLLQRISSCKTEQDVALLLEKNIREQGGELAFPTIVASGKHSAIPHHRTSNAPLKKGFLLIDFGARYQSYCADMTRMLYLGKPTAQEKKLYALLLAAQEAALHSITEKQPFSTLDGLVRKKLGKYASSFIHGLGHGVGIEIHEAPKVSSASVEKVQRGMVFTIEPGIYFPGRFGLRLEDTVLFEGKVTILTKTPKKLICV